jgi:hypothetical protein
MRSPSIRVRKNSVDIYNALPSPQADGVGGPVWTYPPTPSCRGVRCTAQAGSIAEVVDDQDRVTRVIEWKMMFASQQVIKPRDKIIYVDAGCVTHTIYVEIQRDEAGRGGAFTVHLIERI